MYDVGTFCGEEISRSTLIDSLMELRSEEDATRVELVSKGSKFRDSAGAARKYISA